MLRQRDKAANRPRSKEELCHEHDCGLRRSGNEAMSGEQAIRIRQCARSAVPVRQSRSPDPRRLVPAVRHEGGGSQAGEENSTAQHSLKLSPNDFLPGAVVKLLLRDGN